MGVQRFSINLKRAVLFNLENQSHMFLNPEKRSTCKLWEKSGGGGQPVAYSETAETQ